MHSSQGKKVSSISDGMLRSIKSELSQLLQSAGFGMFEVLSIERQTSNGNKAIIIQLLPPDQYDPHSRRDPARSVNELTFNLEIRQDGNVYRTDTPIGDECLYEKHYGKEIIKRISTYIVKQLQDICSDLGIEQQHLITEQNKAKLK